MSWIFALLLIQPLSWSKTLSLELGLGQTEKIRARGVLIMGPDKVVRAKDLGSHYQIEALKFGGTTLRSGEDVYEISVLSQDQIETRSVLEKIARTTLGLKVTVEKGRVLLKGQLLDFQEWVRVAEACLNINCDYEARITVFPSQRDQIQNQMLQYFTKAGFSIATVRWEPFVTLTTTQAKSERSALQKLVDSFGMTLIEDKSSLELAPSVRAQIMILEVKKNEVQKYGIQWPTSYSAQILPKAQQIDRLLLSAQFLEQNGIGRILASPSLLCRTGKESEFLAGGEIPIKIMNFKTQDVLWKKYGILLKLKPFADASGKMSLEIQTEISSIDASHTVDGVPGFFTNRVQSHFDLSSPRTIALSGLIKSEESQASEGLLGLSRIPILGPLFSSRDFRNQRTELVILVRPEVVLPQGDKE